MSIQPETLMNSPMIASLNSGDNTYGAGANGISILEDVLTTPNGITLNSVGISYDSGTSITSTSWDDITTRVSQLSAIAPNGLNATILAVNNTVFIENADTAPTRVITISTDNTDFGIQWEGDTLPFVMTTLDATPLQVKDTSFVLLDSVAPLTTTMTASTLTSGASSASWATIIAGGASIGTLDGVLANGNTATGTYATITLTDTDVGGQANPILILNNTNATGSVGLEVYKNKPTAGVAGDVLFNQSVYGKDSFLNKQEYTRITHTLRDGTGGVEDGSIEFGCFVNGSFNNFLQINGNQNEVNCLKPLDMGGNNILTTAGDIPINATSSTGTGHIDITSKTGAVVNVANNININASASTGNGIINLIPKVSTGAILTDSKIATLNGFSSSVGASIDFGGANPDYNFTISKDMIELNYNNTITQGNQQLFQDIVSEQAFFRQQFVSGGNTLETLIRNDSNSNSIKLSETATTANCEITKDEIDMVDSSAFTSKLTATDLTFNNVSIRPRRTYNTFAFSVNGSPSATILNFGSLADMVANTTWKVDVAFYTGDGNNPRNVLTYVVEDTTAVYRETNSVFGYTQGGLQTAIRYDPTGTPMGTYCSFTDTFEVSNFAVGACSFILTGGTSDSSTWSGTCRVSIVLTRLA